MTIKTQKMYSEVYSILNMLGNTYIEKIPKKVFYLIKKTRLETYNPKYNPVIDLREQNVMKESLNMIALLYLRCWCETENEKEELQKIFNENDVRYQFESHEKNNIEKLFNEKSLTKENSNTKNNSNLLAIVVKNTILTKILNKIKILFRFK